MPSIAAIWAARYANTMRRHVLLLFVTTIVIGCNQWPKGLGGRTSGLRDEEFVEVYVRLSKTNSPAEKARILKEAGTTAREMDEFVKVRLDDLPALSIVFDSVVARMGNPPNDGLGRLPRR